jgi:hypothetical protein
MLSCTALKMTNLPSSHVRSHSTGNEVGGPPHLPSVATPAPPSSVSPTHTQYPSVDSTYAFTLKLMQVVAKLPRVLVLCRVSSDSLLVSTLHWYSASPQLVLLGNWRVLQEFRLRRHTNILRVIPMRLASTCIPLRWRLLWRSRRVSMWRVG